MSDPKRDLVSLFEEASNIHSDYERAAFLAESCGDDLMLRKQIEQLLQSEQNAGSFLETPPEEFGATTTAPSGDDGSGSSLNAGRSAAFNADQAIVTADKTLSVLKRLGNTLEEVPRVALRESAVEGADPISRPRSPELPNPEPNGRYQLQGEIARGGMGAIIKGRDTDLGRDLAIKVLLDSHKDNPDVIQRFVEEAQIGGQLQHPGIAPIYELGQFADERPFFSMKLVKGQTLSKLLADRDRSDQDRARYLGIFEQVCQTMAYAHSRGVIHRDLKPANIMVGAFGEVQVMDWGLAKVLPIGGVADEKRSRMQQDQSIIQTLRSGIGSDSPAIGSMGTAGSETQMGSVMGTPAYMPPEQALGEIDNMDERADVFGLGSMLCEILTGHPPYVADDGTALFRMACRGKLTEAFARLDACGADQDLIALAKNCLAREPIDRPRDAGVLADRVTGYLESVEAKLREVEIKRASEAARADAEAAKLAAETKRAEAEAARATEESKRRRISLALAASVLLFFSLGGGGWLYVERQKSRAQLQHLSEMQRLAIERDIQRKTAENALDVVRDYCMLLAMSGEPTDEQLALKIASNEPEAWRLALRGNAEYCRGNDHVAIELFEKGLEIDSTSIVLKGLLAIAYATTGDFKNYFETSAELKRLAEKANDEERVYAAWGLLATPDIALKMIRDVQTRRSSPMVDLVYGDIAYQIAVETNDSSLVSGAIANLESSRKLLGDTPHFHWIGLKLRHVALQMGDHDSANSLRLREEAEVCIDRLTKFPKTPYAIVQPALFLDSYGTEQERIQAWDALLQSNFTGGWQTYAVRARTLAINSKAAYLDAATALEGNISIFAEYWRAFCLHQAGRDEEAERLYAELERNDVQTPFSSHLYYRELVGPTALLREESERYLKGGRFHSELVRLKARFCAQPSKRNENALRREADDHAVAASRFTTLGTIGRVRLLQAYEAPPNSQEQAIAREKVMKVLNELIDSQSFVSGDYYWAKTMKQRLEQEWGSAH